MRRRTLLSLAALAPIARPALAQPTLSQPSLTQPSLTQMGPAALKIGALYAASGAFTAISMPAFSGMELRFDQLNAAGGAYVKPFGRKIPLRIVSYDDKSNPATAGTLTTRLIAEDKVDILVADSGSVLAAASVPVAREHKVVLFNHSGTGASLFSADNPYIVLTATPYSGIWPGYLVDFLAKRGPALGLKRVALLYATNEFTTTQAAAVRSMLKASGAAVELVFDQGVPTTTADYRALINTIFAANPDAILELGYPDNDIAFLRNLQDSGVRPRFLFTIYAGLETQKLAHSVGVQAMGAGFSYTTPDVMDYKPDFGPDLAEMRDAFARAYPGGKVEFGFNAVVGYTTALVIEKALATTASLAQLDIRKAVANSSGTFRTLGGPFAINALGQQIGAITPLGQLGSDGRGGVMMRPVWPESVATAKPNIGN